MIKKLPPINHQETVTPVSNQETVTYKSLNRPERCGSSSCPCTVSSPSFGNPAAKKEGKKLWNLIQGPGQAAADKILKYRTDYNNNPPHDVAFIPVIDSTSGRLHSEFIRLLFLQGHRETDRFFATSGV